MCLATILAGLGHCAAIAQWDLNNETPLQTSITLEYCDIACEILQLNSDQKNSLTLILTDHAKRFDAFASSWRDEYQAVNGPLRERNRASVEHWEADGRFYRKFLPIANQQATLDESVLTQTRAMLTECQQELWNIFVLHWYETRCSGNGSAMPLCEARPRISLLLGAVEKKIRSGSPAVAEILKVAVRDYADQMGPAKINLIHFNIARERTLRTEEEDRVWIDANGQVCIGHFKSVQGRSRFEQSARQNVRLNEEIRAINQLTYERLQRALPQEVFLEIAWQYWSVALSARDEDVGIIDQWTAFRKRIAPPPKLLQPDMDAFERNLAQFEAMLFSQVKACAQARDAEWKYNASGAMRAGEDQASRLEVERMRVAARFAAATTSSIASLIELIPIDQRPQFEAPKQAEK